MGKILIIASFVVFLTGIGTSHAQTTDGLRGSVTISPDERCARGVADPEDSLGTPPGEVCKREPLTSEQKAANECAIEAPEIVSRCDAGKCVAKEMCNKPLPQTPTEIPDGTNGGTSPQPSPTPSPTPLPSQPGPIQLPTEPSPTPSIPSPGSGGAGSGTGGSSGSPSPSPMPTPTPTPTPSTNAPQPGTGTTFSNPGSPFTLGPSTRPGSTFGGKSDGVFSGGTPFGSGSNTTFSGSFGSVSGSGSANLFSSFLSVIGSLISGFGGGSSNTSNTGSAPAVNSNNPTPRPSEPATPTPSTYAVPPRTPPTQSPTAGIVPHDTFLEELEKGNQLPAISPQLADRIGLPGPLSPTVSSNSGISIPTTDYTNAPQVMQPPANPPPVGVTVPKPGASAVSPTPTVANPAQNIPVTRVAAQATFEKAREGLADRSAYDKFLDWLGIGSDEGNSYEKARINLQVITMREGVEELAEKVRAIPTGVQVAEGGDVMTDAEPIDEQARENSLSPADKEKFEREYAEFEKKYLAAKTDEERANIIQDTMQKIGAMHPAFAKALAGNTFKVTAELLSQEPEGVQTSRLEGLSSLGASMKEAVQPVLNRFATLGTELLEYSQDAVESVYEAFSAVSVNPASYTEPPTTTTVELPTAGSGSAPANPSRPSPEPSPAPSPQPTQASAGGGNYFQATASLISTLFSLMMNLFKDDGAGSSSQQSQPQAQPPAPSASITANPSLIDVGGTSRLSWSSVGTQGCAVVDATLAVIASDGQNGDLTSSALSESTRFGVICNIKGGKDKFVNETLVRVRGDESDPATIFAQAGVVSSAPAPTGTSTSSSGSGASSGTGTTNNPAPVDVRTCDPEQPIDTFIKCLCEAEPNPNGCSI